MTQFPTSSQIKIWQPVAAGGFIGMLGALVLANLREKGKPLEDGQFLIVLLVCIVLGSLFAVGLSYYLYRRQLRKQMLAEEELYLPEVEQRKGSTSTITLRPKIGRASCRERVERTWGA